MAEKFKKALEARGLKKAKNPKKTKSQAARASVLKRFERKSGSAVTQSQMNALKKAGF